MRTEDLVQQIWRARATLNADRIAATPQSVYLRMIPSAQDAWDANDLPDTWLTANLYLLRRRLAANERSAA